jgi:hypothetical protein
MFVEFNPAIDPDAAVGAALRSPRLTTVAGGAVHSLPKRGGGAKGARRDLERLVRAGRHSIDAMAWGTIEAEPEVTEWLLGLDDEDFGQVERYIDLLADEGVHLAEPFSRQLRGKLRELRFYLGRAPTRITYYLASRRRIVLLTVFAKTRPRERAEIERAWRAMQRCIAEGHVAEEES